MSAANHSEFLTKAGLAKAYPGLITIPKLNWYVARREVNGLQESGALRRNVANRWLFDRQRFLEWYLGTGPEKS